MARVVRALPGETRELALKPWLYRIAHNEAMRIAGRRRPQTALEDAPEVAARPDAEDRETRERLDELLARPPGTRPPARVRACEQCSAFAEALRLRPQELGALAPPLAAPAAAALLAKLLGGGGGGTAGGLGAPSAAGGAFASMSLPSFTLKGLATIAVAGAWPQVSERSRPVCPARETGRQRSPRGSLGPAPATTPATTSRTEHSVRATIVTARSARPGLATSANPAAMSRRAKGAGTARTEARGALRRPIAGLSPRPAS